MHPLLRPFALTLAYLAQTQNILHTMDGNALACIRLMRMASREAAPAGFGTPESALEDMAAMESFVARDIPLANGHALVGLWGAFEAWAKDVVVARVALMESAPLPDNVANLALRSGTTIALSDVLKDHATSLTQGVISVIEDAARGKSGLGCIEARLSPLGVSVAVSKETRDAFYYAEKIRHLYAHRAGIVDAKFLAECPTLAVVEGKRYLVSAQDMDQYVSVFREYLFCALDPVREVLEIALPPGDDAVSGDSGGP